ncbi:MAG: M4 family metallopeptidase [Gammaproteobacteria bacterium]|nr:M4 family metallopeptidase [Gammaproteobacteria bacterium]
MMKDQNKFLFSRSILFGLSLTCFAPGWAATPVNLQHQSLSSLQSLMSSQTELAPLSSNVDFNQTKHLRLQQTFQGYKVWAGDVVAHIPHGANTKGLRSLNAQQRHDATLNGMVFQDLAKDLADTPAYIFTSAQADKALQQSIQDFQKKSGSKSEIKESKSELMVYVDKNNKAHWAFHVSFFTTNGNMPVKPIYILDAQTFAVYQQWNNLQTVDNVEGGGFGGNPKMGKLVYDGLKGDYASLSIERDEAGKVCSLANDDVAVQDRRHSDALIHFDCSSADADHNNVFWDADLDKANGGYSPSNDALYAGKVIKEMYRKWYDLPVLVKDGKPMLLVMRVHESMDNAYWDGASMTFGDGISMFYPLTSLGVAAHEVSHGFTEQHSNLTYEYQSGGLNEAFSDMAAQAAEFYSVGKNSWQIGPEIFKAKGQALRYMDDPSKDCEGRQPGSWCSISKLSEYNDGIDVHYTSGVFNKAFYLLGTSEGWDTKKAFDVMVKANTDYWTSNTTFVDAACGVMKATEDYKYDVKAVADAMKGVGIDVSKC